MMENMKDAATPGKNVNIRMPIWLIERMKLRAIGKSYREHRLYYWTDLLRASLTEQYRTIKSKEKK